MRGAEKKEFECRRLAWGRPSSFTAVGDGGVRCFDWICVTPKPANYAGGDWMRALSSPVRINVYLRSIFLAIDRKGETIAASGQGGIGGALATAAATRCRALNDDASAATWAGAPADRLRRSMLWRGRCALAAVKVDRLPEIVVRRGHVRAPVASASGPSRLRRAAGRGVRGDLLLERLEIGGSLGRRGRRLRRGRRATPGVDRPFGRRRLRRALLGRCLRSRLDRRLRGRLASGVRPSGVSRRLAMERCRAASRRVWT